MPMRTWLLLVALALSPGVGSADDSEDRAKAIIVKGNEAFKAGRYLESAELYKDAYAVHPYKGVVFNIAYAYLKADEKRFAYLYFKRFLDLRRAGKRADASRKAIAEIEAELGQLDLETIERELIADDLPDRRGGAEDGSASDQVDPGETANVPEEARSRAIDQPIVSDTAGDTVARSPGPPELYTPPSSATTATRRPPLQPVGPARPAPYAIPFRGLDPVQPHGQIAIAVLGGLTKPDYAARLRAQANIWSFFGVRVTAQSLFAAEYDEDDDDQDIEVYGIANPELGLYLRHSTRPGASGNRWTGMLYGSVAPRLNTFSSDSMLAPADVNRFVVQRLGNFNRLAQISPETTTFSIAVATQFESEYAFARLAAEINLFAGPPGRVTMGRFDGDLGLQIRKFKVAIGSVTRVGGVIGQLAGTDDNVLQTLGGSVSFSFLDHFRAVASSGVAVVSLPASRTYLMLGVERDLRR